MKEDVQQQVSELEEQYSRGQISRRDFLRALALLGIGLGLGEVTAACSPAADAVRPSAASATPTALHREWINDPGFGEVTPGPAPTSPWAGQPVAGSSAAAEPAAAGPTPAEEQASPTAPEAPQQPPAAKVFFWSCTSCRERFPNLDALERHTLKVHWRRIPEIRQVDEPTYARFIVGELERFDERNTAFCREVWDKEYQAQLQAAAALAPPLNAKGIEGRALGAGAIFVDDYAGSFNPEYRGYDGRQREGGGLYSWDEEPSPERFPVDDPEWMTARVKQVARFFGASLVGITKVDPRWVYSHYFERTTGKTGKLEIRYRYAVVIATEMDWDFVNTSPDWEASAAAALGYSHMVEVAGSLARYIRMLGYPAVPSGNDTAQSIPLAIDAGLGELGRNGLLLTPEFGPRVRLCKVFTDLPLIPDRPIDFGIQTFCETCHSCAQSCPVDAIQWGDRSTEVPSICNRKGLLRWTVDTARCYLYWKENGKSCGNCMAACPWAFQNPRDWLEYPKQ
jgi:NAD-dependent dihydropyrimidine dehydrogenase PreA subunit